MVTLFPIAYYFCVCWILQWAEECHKILFSWTDQSIEIKQFHSYMTGYNYIKKNINSNR